MPAARAADAPAHVADVIVEGNANIRVAPEEVATTSVARRGMGFDECTVRFRRWATHGNTAYQNGQYAGFRLAEALLLEKRGVAFIVTEPVGASRMVTK